MERMPRSRTRRENSFPYALSRSLIMNLGAVFQGKALIVCWPSQKAVECQNNEDVKNLESNGGHGEQVDGDDALGLVAQEGVPGLRSGPSRFGSDPVEVSGARDRKS